MKRHLSIRPVAFLLLITIVVFSLASIAQQKPKREWSPAAQPILDGIRHLRSVPDADRGRVTRDLALRIRELPAGKDKTDLAIGLAHLSTEGDFGSENLQEVTTTLAMVLKETPLPREKNGAPAEPYSELASLVRYEHMKTSFDDPQYSAAMALLEAQDKKLQSADFTLVDTAGKSWTLKQLKGKVVLVNFWATWCPPCRKEMPDLQALSDEFGKQGFVVLGLTDEEPGVVNGFLSKQTYSYPILLDSGRKAAAEFGVDGIPKSFVYDRDGKLVAQSIDMRTRSQFKVMLAEAGLK
jgi:thiol-disulfide isomerase/thioredoxin